MSDEATSPLGEDHSEEPKRPASRHWRGRTKTVPLAQDHAKRQGEITLQAFLLLGKTEAIAFLNTENERLGGRPLAIATQSEAGRIEVAAEMQRLQRASAETPHG